jgi:hypothetical protein
MARILTQEISGFECIGDTRPKINTNFENLDVISQSLSSFALALSSYDTDIIDPVLTVVRSNSASWEESADIIPTVTNHLSTNDIFVNTLTSTAIRTNGINIFGSIDSTGNLTINNITAAGYLSSDGNITTNSDITALGNIATQSKFLSAGIDLQVLFRQSGPIPLSALADVVFTNLSANQVLRFDGGLWRNHDNTAAQQLSGLTDVIINYPILSGHVLRYDGNIWYNDYDLAEQTRLAKAWLNYDGVNNVIRSSFNISSVTSLGTGHYKINYTPGTFTHNNYSFVATCDETFSAGPIGYYIWSQPTNYTLSSTEVKHRSYAAGTTETNPSILSVVVFASGN